MSEGRALDGIRVLDVTDDLGAYAPRLLADLGASVVRIETPEALGLAGQDPLVDAPGGGSVSLFERFVNAGKERLVLDLDDAGARRAFDELVAACDVLIESSWRGEVLDLSGHPRLIRVVVTPFGRGLNPDWEPVDDLVVLGAGGLLALGGYRDLGPIAAFGGQSRYAASIYAAVAALVALIEREESGRGALIDVSAQECIAQALEDSVPTFALTGRERERFGEVSREAGSGTYACADGRVSMIAGRLGTARAWAALVGWMNEEGAPGAEVLLDEKWSDFGFRQTEEAARAFTEIFEAFAATRSKQELYEEAQRRGIALSPINQIGDLMSNPQLEERGFFQERHDEELGQTLVFPGAPYRLSLTPPVVGSIMSPARTEIAPAGQERVM